MTGRSAEKDSSPTPAQPQTPTLIRQLRRHLLPHMREKDGLPAESKTDIGRNSSERRSLAQS